MLKVVRHDHFGPPQLIKTPFNGWVFRALGGSITWRKPTETFHEFCFDVVKRTFGQEWLDAQFKSEYNERHVVAKWLSEYSDLTKRDKPPNHQPGQLVSSVPTGGVQEAILLGRDLVYLTQLGKLPNRVVERLRHKDQFQGAWYEIRIASALIHGGFEIEWLQKKAASHCEFTAVQSFTKEKFAVEAKSKHRTGTLNQPGDKLDEVRVLADRLFRDALRKDAEGLPLLIFVDVNMPLNDSLEDAAFQWGNHMAGQIGAMGINTSEPATFAYVACTNFSWHQQLSAAVKGMGVLYEKVPMFSVNPIKNIDSTVYAIEAGLKRVGVPPPHNL
jgi:hypothetical protein